MTSPRVTKQLSLLEAKAARLEVRIAKMRLSVEAACVALDRCLPILEQRSFTPRGGRTALSVGPEIQNAIELVKDVLAEAHDVRTELRGQPDRVPDGVARDEGLRQQDDPRSD